VAQVPLRSNLSPKRHVDDIDSPKNHKGFNKKEHYDKITPVTGVILLEIPQYRITQDNIG